MAKIIKIFKDKIDECYLLGKCYHESDKDQFDTYSTKWTEWFEKRYFEDIEKCGKPYYNGDYIGAMRNNNGVLEYWIGILFEKIDSFPEGYEVVTIDSSNIGVGYVKGIEDPSLYIEAGKVYGEFQKAGYKFAKEAWFMERYNCPRFTTPDESGEVILDIIAFIE